MSTIEKRDEAIDLARYKQAADEIEAGSRDDALWYKAFTEGGGDENATKAAYIRLRVEQLRREAVTATEVRVTATQPNSGDTQAAPQPAKPEPEGDINLYDRLGVTRDANNTQIHAGYQQQKWQLETQENKGAETTKKLLIIEHAKRVLLDPARRAAYDATISNEATQTEKSQQKKSSDRSMNSVSEPLSNHDLYAAYLGEKNQAYYLEKFERFDRLGDGMHISWNWPACITSIFGSYLWPLYRKIYGLFFALFISVSILYVILYAMGQFMPVVNWTIGIAIAVAFGMFANVIYYRKVKGKIAAAQRVARDDNELIYLLREKGGVHSWVWWILWIWLSMAVIGIIAAIAIPAYSDYTKKAKAQVSSNVPHAAQGPTIQTGQGVSYDQNDPPFKEANLLSAAGKYAEAVEIWRPLAEQGNARAQHAMGASYLAGRGVPKDYSEAAKWLRLSSEQGDARAQFRYGWMYGSGTGVAENQQEAVKWYRLAAEQGYAIAQLFLGLAYGQGKGVIEDGQEAVKWYRLAAKQGDSGAQGALGSAYNFGVGVPRDKVKAHMWYSIAAAIGDKDTAQNNSIDRDGIASVMSQSDITRSQQMAKECMNSNYENCD